MSETTSIYLSYHPQDRTFALKLAADLKNAGVKVWADYLEIDIKPAELIASKRDEQRSNCSAFLAILSSSYVGDEKCRSEMSEAQSQSKTIIPILLDAPENVSSAYPNAIQFSMWRNPDQYAQSFQNIMPTVKDFVGDIPSSTDQYLNTLAAELISYDGVINYVSLSVHAEPADEAEFDLNLDEEESDDDVDDDAETDEDELADDFESLDDASGAMLTLSDIHEALEIHPACILLGAAGSGKSTTLRRVALEKIWAYRSDRFENPLPIWIDLADEGGEQYAKLLSKHAPLEQAALAELILEDQIILFLDGLNEMGENAARNAKQLSDWLYEADSPEQVIVACRAASYGEALNLDLPLVMLDPLDSDRVHDLTSYHLPKNLADQFLGKVLNEAGVIKNTLVMMPMYLRKLLDIFQDQSVDELPTTVSRLLQNWIVFNWKVANQPQDSFVEITKTLSELAAGMLDQNASTSVSLTSAIQMISGKNRPDNDENRTIMSQLYQAVEANLVLLKGTKLRFAHPLLGSYFAAVTLQRDGVQHTVSKPVFDNKEFRRLPGKWDQPVMLLLGTVDDKDGVVLEVAKRDPYLAVACVAGGISVSDETKQVLRDVLSDKLDQNDWRLTYTTVRSLIQLGQADLVWSMIEDLAYGSPFKQRVAAWALGEIRHPASIPVLVEALENVEIRPIVQKALIKIGAPSIPEMVPLLDEEEYETHWDLRNTVAQTLAAIGDPEAIDYLLESLYDSVYEVRWSVANALSTFGEAAVSGLVEVVFEAESLEEEDGDTCHAAASALVWIGSQTAIEGLLNALRDANSSRRAIVAESLAEATHPLAVPALIERLGDTDYADWDDEESIADIAAMSLSRIGTHEAITAVEKWQNETS